MLDRVLNAVLVVAAAAIAIVVVRREFFGVDQASPRARDLEYVAEWESFVSFGRVHGPHNAPIAIIQFADFECSFCREFDRTKGRIEEKYPGQVLSVFVHYPIAGHRFAIPAARASECANVQGKFNAMATALFKGQDSIGLLPWTEYARRAGITALDQFARCAVAQEVPAVVDSGRILGQRIGISGTPTVFINGWRFPGTPSEHEMTTAVDRLLAGKTPKP